MKISVLIINSNPEKLDLTIKSLSYQTFEDYESLIIPSTVDNRLEELKSAVEQAQGDYCLFLNSGDTFANDRVIEEVVLNGLDKDIVYGNVIINRGDINDRNNYILLPKQLSVSDILLKPFPHQCMYIKSVIVKRIEAKNGYNSVAFCIWANTVKSILIDHISYKHIQIFVAECNIVYLDKCLVDKYIEQNFPLLHKDYNDLHQLKSISESETQYVLNKISKTVFFKWLSSIRYRLKTWGYYEFNSKIKHKRHYNKLKKQDEAKKKEIEKKISLFPSNLLQKNNDETDIIVSLTSYGRRVSDSVPYALYSIFTQSHLPNRIILFLDRTWNNNNLPQLLKELLRCGLEIEYCDDLRSFKKLIPAIQKYSNNPIITVDDDFYYNQELIKGLIAAYNKSDKKTVIGSWGCIVDKKEGLFTPYSTWKDSKYGNSKSQISLFAGNGTIYPPKIFDDEICNKEVFMKYLPTADDIWFWVNEYRFGVEVKLMVDWEQYPNQCINNIDDIEKYSTALFFQNVIHGSNDKSFNEILKYYNIQ